MLFKERRTGWKDGRERQEKSAGDGTESFGKPASGCRNEAPQQEPKRVLVPLGFLERLEIDSDDHYRRSPA